jgi:hypothetical protein
MCVRALAGRIRAMQLEYTKAHQHLLTAIRKAPQQTAIGFRQNVIGLGGALCDRVVCVRVLFLGVQVPDHG